MTTAWVFAGHGAQYPGMGRAILRETAAGRCWLAAAEAASGLKLGEFALHGPARALIDPMVLEPLLAAIGGAYVDLLSAAGQRPHAVAGYSAGHLPALYAAGVIDRETCIRIACIRGTALAVAAQMLSGGMVAVHGLPEQQLVCLAEDDPTDPASVAARNAPMHVIYAGTSSALAAAATRATRAGAVVSDPLDVAGPWHSPLLEPARTVIKRAIGGLPFRAAQMPVFSTVTALATRDPEALRCALAASVASTVEWHATVQAMGASGIDAFVEVSPGRSLWGLLGQQDRPLGFTRSYQECVRGPVRTRLPRAARTATQQPALAAQVSA